MISFDELTREQQEIAITDAQRELESLVEDGVVQVVGGGIITKSEILILGKQAAEGSLYDENGKKYLS